MKRSEIDWNEAPLVRWLGTTTRKRTQYTYRAAFRAYSEYTGLTATQLIDEAIKDARKDVRERKDILKTRLLGFYNWLKTEYEVSSRGSEKYEEHIVVRKGLRDKSANTFVNAVRSFYGTFDLNVKLKGRERLPKPRVYNKRLQLTTVDVKALVDHVRSPRDRAIILTIFQGGMDVSTLCSMKYEDIAKGIAANEHPLKVELFREKSGTEYYTFLGRDAVESIKAYLNDAKSRGIVFKPSMPLFVKEAPKGEPMDTYLVQKILRETAVRCGLVDEENNGKDMSPVNPHALRESFGSIMINNGVPDTIVDFWLGHEIGEMSEAYKGARLNELKTLYAQKEKLISISVSESQAVDDLRREFGDNYTRLLEENRKLRQEMQPFIRAYEKLEALVGKEDAPTVLEMLLERDAVETISAEDVAKRKQKP